MTDAAIEAPRRRRKSKADLAAAEAQKLAELLAAAPAESSDPLAPPALITDPRLAGALQVWREHAPHLQRMGHLTRTDRLSFALFCVYAADFAAAQGDILEKGYSIACQTLSGGVMLRLNPAVRRRDAAAAMMLDLSARFGLTPMDRYRLSAAKALTADEELPFDDDRPAPGASAPVGEAAGQAKPASRWDELLGPRAPKPH